VSEGPEVDRPRVGISRCLLGDEVRHDGGHKYDPTLAALGAVVEWVPVCPEVEVGMGVPREPIRLVSSADGTASSDERVRVIGVGSGIDWTPALVTWAQRRARELRELRLSGFVLKARSPSCGPNAVAVVHAGDETVTPTGRGLFAQALFDAIPDLPVEDEERLRDPDARDAFLARVAAYRRR
jgi:uncharacterized protein YbbK (DUF523 family)